MQNATNGKTFELLQNLLQDFQSASDHFVILGIKGLKTNLRHRN